MITYDKPAVTVQNVIDLQDFRSGMPAVLAENDTDTPVRWVHVLENMEAHELLEGGEFVFTTATFLDAPTIQRDRIRLAEEFLDRVEYAGAVAVAAEILPDRSAVASALRAAAAGRTVSIYLLTSQIRFVALTQAIHERISANQVNQLTTDRHIHNVFTELSLRSADPDRVLKEASRLLELPVTWEENDETSSLTFNAMPIIVAGEPSGHLTAHHPADDQERDLPAESLTRTVLERAAQALTLTLLNERSQRDLALQAESALLHELRRPRHLTEDHARQRLYQVLGSRHPTARRALSEAAFWLPVVLHVQSADEHTQDVRTQHRDDAVLDHLNQAAAAAGATALAARMEFGTVAALLPLRAEALQDQVLARVLADVEQRIDLRARPEITITAGVGPVERRLLSAASNLDEAQRIADAAVSLRAANSVDRRLPSNGHGRLYFYATDVRLRGLLATLREDERVRDFAASELSGIVRVEAPEQTAGDLHLLEQFLAAGGNKSTLAHAMHLSRPALYGRLERLERALGVSLSDPESRTSLHVALLFHRMQRY